jgi:hypothetical protein
LLVEAQRVRHDQRRGAGDRNEADLEIGLLKRAFLLRHGLQAGHGQHTGNGCHGRALAHRAQEVAAHVVMGEYGLDQRGLDKFVAVDLELAGEAAPAQFNGSGIGGHFGVMIGQRMVTPATALEHQGTVSVVRGEKLGHGAPLQS